MAGVIRHVLLDADGVLQHVGEGWAEITRTHLGDRGRELLEAFWAFEGAALVGQGDVVEALRTALSDLGIDADADELYPLIWLRIDVVPASMELVRRLRGAGYGVHLGTNQTAPRAAHMRTDLGYDDLFDVSVYSCDIGAAKPDVDYFVRAAELIGAPPEEILFVDDREADVLGAREAGMLAEHWTFRDGHDVIESRLAAHGVRLGA